jgi:uncharacterized damage-inducible protein DinB
MIRAACDQADTWRVRKADVLHLIDYMYWVNGRLLDATEPLTTAELAAPTAVTTRDLRATLVHELDVEWSWRLNLQGQLTEATEELRPEDHADVAELRDHWRRDEAEMRSWLDPMTDEDIAAPVRSDLSKDARPLWQYLLHIVFHATQQQADAATLLTLAGRSPGDIGYLEMMRERSAPQ